jgi:DNA-binding NtrC family response regulator
VVLAEGDAVGLAEFPQVTAQLGNHAGNTVSVHTEELSDADIGSAEHGEPALIPHPFEDEAQPLPDFVPALAPGDTLPLRDAEGEVRPLDEIEAELIRYAITHYRGQMSEVARRLQIGRSTLYRKLEALGLNSERAEEDSEVAADPVAAGRQPQKIA